MGLKKVLSCGLSLVWELTGVLGGLGNSPRMVMDGVIAFEVRVTGCCSGRSENAGKLPG